MTLQPDATEYWLTPRLRPSVRVGEMMYDGNKLCAFVMDLDTGLMIRIGQHEHFILNMLDGFTTQKEISNASLTHFGSPIPPKHWNALLQMLWERGLLDGISSTELKSLRSRMDKERSQSYTLMHRRFPIKGAEKILSIAYPVMSWLFNPLFLLLGTLIGSGICITALLEVSNLVAVATQATHYWGLITLTIVITFGVVLLHELGHGVACLRFGGKVQEFGLLWRIPIIAPYCKVDSVIILKRYERLIVSFAGVFINFLALIPFGILYVTSPEGSFLQSLGAALLLAGIPSIFVNLIPVFFLDGHRMFEHATGIYRITYHVFIVIGAILSSKRKNILGYSPYVLGWIAVYIIIATIILGGALIWLVRIWWITLEHHWGPWNATLFLTGEAVLVIILIILYLHWKKNHLNKI